jgi:hypothetical protein
MAAPALGAANTGGCDRLLHYDTLVIKEVRSFQ